MRSKLVGGRGSGARSFTYTEYAPPAQTNQPTNSQMQYEAIMAEIAPARGPSPYAVSSVAAANPLNSLNSNQLEFSQRHVPKAGWLDGQESVVQPTLPSHMKDMQKFGRRFSYKDVLQACNFFETMQQVTVAISLGLVLAVMVVVGVAGNTHQRSLEVAQEEALSVASVSEYAAHKWFNLTEHDRQEKLALDALIDEVKRERPIEFLENGIIRVGVDLNYGAAITHLSDAADWNHKNVLAKRLSKGDVLKHVHVSFENGPDDFSPEGRCDRKPGWNPRSLGDIHGNQGEVLDYKRTDSSLQIYMRPLHWGCVKVPCDCTFKVSIELEDSAVWVTADLIMDAPPPKPWYIPKKAPKSEYGEREQQLPSVFFQPKFSRLLVYDDNMPFKNGAINELKCGWDAVKEYWRPGHFTGTEHWAAIVNGADYGVGLYQPKAKNFIAGFMTPLNVPGAAVGHLAATMRMEIAPGGEYGYRFALILGHIQDIRAYVYQQEGHQPVVNDSPDFHFINYLYQPPPPAKGKKGKKG